MFELDTARGGSYCGNIGRCLWFKGDSKNALTCLRKSAFLLEGEHGRALLHNQGWAAHWIGEVFQQSRDFEMAWISFRYAEGKWKDVSPLRAEKSSRAAEEIERELGPSAPTLGLPEITRRYTVWLNGLR